MPALHIGTDSDPACCNFNPFPCYCVQVDIRVWPKLLGHYIQVGDLEEASDSQLQIGSTLAVVAILIKPADEKSLILSVSLSFYNSAFQIDKYINNFIVYFQL